MFFLARAHCTSGCHDADSVHADGIGQVQDMHLALKMHVVYLEDINFALPSIWVLSIYWSVVGCVCQKNITFSTIRKKRCYVATLFFNGPKSVFFLAQAAYCTPMDW